MRPLRRMSISMISAALAALLVPVGTAGAGTPQAAPGKVHGLHEPDRILLHTILDQESHNWGVPAMAGAVIHTDNVTADAVGVRVLGGDDQVTTEDRFHLGSLTKAMTASMIGTIVDDGLLGWDSTPGGVFPAHSASMNPQLRDVTLDQLLSHHAGIAAFHLDEFAGLPTFTGSPSKQRQQFSLYLLRRPPAVPVGSFLYSNADYTIATTMAEAVTGRTWEQLMRSRLLKPLDIEEHIGWPAAEDRRQPVGHWNLGAGLVPGDPTYGAPTIIGPASDLNMSVNEFARFAQMHLRGLRGLPTLLSATTMTKMHTPIPPEGDLGPYALGWEVFDFNGVTTSAHDGTVEQFYAIVAVQPSRDLAVVVFANAGGYEGGNAVGSSVGRLLTEL